MKPLLLCLLSLCIGARVHAAGSMHTAHYVQAHAAQLVGKKHTVRVSMCRPARTTDTAQWYLVCTEDRENEPGGWIEVRVPLANSSEFLRRYDSNLDFRAGAKVKARNLEATVALVEGVAYLDLAPELPHAAPTTSGPIAPLIRTWTALDGRTLEAEYLSATATHVRFRRASDGEVFDYELARLSQEDRAWVAARRGQ